METWQADSLAAVLCRSFPRSSIAADVWAEELGPLDTVRAEEAVRRIRRTFEHPPTIAAVHAVYANLLGSADTATEVCDHCGNTGIITDTDHPRHWPGRPGTIPTPMGPVDFTDDAGNAHTRIEPTGECACNVATWCRQCDQGPRARHMLQQMSRPDAA